jgi:hypothetical protein
MPVQEAEYIVSELHESRQFLRVSAVITEFAKQIKEEED